MDNPNLAELPPSIVEAFHASEFDKAMQTNSTTYALRRLKRDRPDLLQRVTQGELSAHRAMIDAGFRQRRFSIPQDNVAGAADAIRKRLSETQIQALVEELRQSL